MTDPVSSCPDCGHHLTFDENWLTSAWDCPDEDCVSHEENDDA